jgi:hypothetical protein
LCILLVECRELFIENARNEQHKVFKHFVCILSTFSHLCSNRDIIFSFGFVMLTAHTKFVGFILGVRTIIVFIVGYVIKDLTVEIAKNAP